VRKSKYTTKVYTLSESLKLYYQAVQYNKIDISQLIESYKQNNFLIMSCYCGNFELHDKDQSLDNLRCHGQIIAHWIFKKTA
jgi:hypothetical protein